MVDSVGFGLSSMLLPRNRGKAGEIEWRNVRPHIGSYKLSDRSYSGRSIPVFV